MAVASEISPVEVAAKAVSEGEIVKWSDLGPLIASPSTTTEVELAPPRDITDAEREALQRLPEVYGRVVPDTIRELTPEEHLAIYEERTVLKTVEKMSKDRLDDITRTVMNAFEAARPDDGAPKNKNGHSIVKESIAVGNGRRWSKETRAGKPTLNPDDLKAMAADESVEGWTHEDYLAVTTQVRVLDENKLMLYLRQHPEKVPHIAQATTRTDGTVALYDRKA